jgi:hypothetical protein
MVFLSGGKGLKTNGGQELGVCLALVMVRCQGLVVHGNGVKSSFVWKERLLKRNKKERE